MIKMSASDRMNLMKDLKKTLNYKLCPHKDKAIRTERGLASNTSLNLLLDSFTSGNGSMAELYDLIAGGEPAIARSLQAQKDEKRGSYGGPFLTTADFANFLNDAIRKQAAASYENLRGYQCFKDWIHLIYKSDFKEIERPQLGQAGGLELTLPGGEATINESYHRLDPDRMEVYKISTYKRISTMTRQAFISDQTGEFSAVFESVTAAAELEADLVVKQLVGGQVGGEPTYSSARNNSHSTNSLESGVRMMMEGLRKQKGFRGTKPLNLELGHLVVPASLEMDAHKLRYSLFGENMDVGFKVNVEARLDDEATTNVYGIAKQTDICPFIDLATVEGLPPQVSNFISENNDVVCWGVTHHCASKVINFESAQRCTITS